MEKNKQKELYNILTREIFKTSHDFEYMESEWKYNYYLNKLKIAHVLGRRNAKSHHTTGAADDNYFYSLTCYLLATDRLQAYANFNSDYLVSEMMFMDENEKENAFSANLLHTHIILTGKEEELAQARKEILAFY